MFPEPIFVNSVVYGVRPGADPACDGAIECLVAQALDPAAVGAMLFGLLIVSMAVGQLADAIDIVQSEIQRTRVEKSALESFADRVEAVSVPEPVAAIGRSDRFETTTDDDPAATVVTAYRETLMAVPHYDREYDEPLATNMATEVGEEVTVALLSSDQMTPALQEAIVAKATDAAERRGEFIGVLETELDSVRTGKERLETINADYQALTPIEEGEMDPESIGVCFRRLEERCTDLVRSRQEQIHDEPMNRRQAADDDSLLLQEYLYHPLSVTYPVLNAGTDILEAVRDSRRITLQS